MRPDEVPADSVTCIGTIFGLSDPCRSEPLLFLSYGGLDLDLTNNARPGPTNLAIDVHHQLGAVDPPPVTSLAVSASFDDGVTWTPVKVQASGPSAWAVKIDNPPKRAATGDVSLRVHATDAAGNSVEQTLTHYGLTH